MYYYSKKINGPFEETISKLIVSLQHQGFGVLTTIDVKDTLKKRLNVDFMRYKILGACNPQFAYKALALEPTIGVMLPCNIAIQEHSHLETEVSAINPMETIAGAVDNPPLEELAKEVSARLMAAIDELWAHSNSGFVSETVQDLSYEQSDE